MSKNSIHPGINQIITEYLNLVDEYNPELLEGFYIYGSVALGDYSLKLSDIDFIAVSKNRLTKEDISKLEGIHQMIRKAYPKPSLEGIYVTWDDLGKLNDIEPYPYYHEGKMHESGLFECNPVTRHELITCGIAIQGPEVSELDITQDWDQLIQLMNTNLNTYWLNWIKLSSKRISMNSVSLLCSKAAVEWGVLGITRLYYTFHENQITSKARAGEYALRVVPERWHRVIQESINYRRGISKSLYRSVWKRRADTLAYMNYILNECNKLN
jgi:Domain of unknown function (DUF4111)